jgi:hypothetical protein
MYNEIYRKLLGLSPLPNRKDMGIYSAYFKTNIISNNNQSLLWKVINNTPQTINYFAGAPPGEKEKWFQYIIGQVYNQFRGQNLSLKDMNKRAIDAMLQSIHVPSLSVTQSTPSSVPYQSAPMAPSQSAPMAPYQSVTQSTPSQSAPMAPSQSVPSQSAPMAPYRTKEQTLNEQFSRRQAEYDLMTKKETPTPHFTENVKDEAILDLNSAVEAYKRNRNEDVDVVIPPPPQQASQSPLKLNLKDAQPVSLVIDEIVVDNKSPEKKAVQWGQNTEHVFDNNYSILLEKDIAEIKSQLAEILSLLRPSAPL